MKYGQNKVIRQTANNFAPSHSRHQSRSYPPSSFPKDSPLDHLGSHYYPLQELRTSTPVSLAVSDLFALPAFVEALVTDVPLPFLYAIDPVSSFPQAT